MKYLLSFTLSVFIITGLHAQTLQKLKPQSYEFTLGMGKVDIMENNNLVYALNNSPVYDVEYMFNKGVEVNSRFSSNWTFNKRHELIVGIDISMWSRKSVVTNGDIISNWQDNITPSRTFSGQADIILGYRFFLLSNESKSLFVENTFHKRLYSGKFPGVNFSTEPGIGAKLKINESYDFITVLNYKQPIGDAYFNEIYQNNFGVRLGINKTL